MSWNNGLERKRFVKKQKRLKKQYEAFGMSEEHIQGLQKLDLDEFNENRAYRLHTQPLDGITDCIEDDDRNSIEAFPGLIINNDTETIDYSSPFAWIEQLDTAHDAVSKLLHEDKELLTLLVIYGYPKTVIAKDIFHVSESTITKRLKRIRKMLSADSTLEEASYVEN